MTDINCAECGSPMVLRTSKKYKYPSGGFKKFYGCSAFPKCRGIHGAHPDGKPLGTPADQETRTARHDAHLAMESWMDRNGYGSNKEAYNRLNEDFGCEVHIGDLDLSGCQKMITYFNEG